MSKIREAREDVQAYFDGVNCDPVTTIFKIHGQTILTALTALERMQGVDLDILPTSIEIVTNHQAWRRGADIEMEDVKNLGIAIDDVLNAAKTLAVMKKEVE